MLDAKQVCKSYTIQGTNGCELELAETVGRQEIEITIRGFGDPATVRLDAVHFEALCNMNSAYNGLEVRKSAALEPELEPVADANNK